MIKLNRFIHKKIQIIYSAPFSSTRPSSSAPILHQLNNNVALIQLNRPKQLNALNNEMIRQLNNLLENFKNDKNIEAIIVKGSGNKAFCAGGDIKEVRETWFNDNKLTAIENMHEENVLMYKINQMNKPYISLIDGITMGSGAGKT
jgi:enoyl-CoA hydratase/carnithine racemase